MENVQEIQLDKSKLFLTTKDVCKLLGIGRKKCLALFHRADFPCLIYGKTFLIEKNSFLNYFKTRNVILSDANIEIEWKNEDLNMEHLNLQYVFSWKGNILF